MQLFVSGRCLKLGHMHNVSVYANPHHADKQTGSYAGLNRIPKASPTHPIERLSNSSLLTLL